VVNPSIDRAMTSGGNHSQVSKPCASTRTATAQVDHQDPLHESFGMLEHKQVDVHGSKQFLRRAQSYENDEKGDKKDRPKSCAKRSLRRRRATDGAITMEEVQRRVNQQTIQNVLKCDRPGSEPQSAASFLNVASSQEGSASKKKETDALSRTPDGNHKGYRRLWTFRLPRFRATPQVSPEDS